MAGGAAAANSWGCCGAGRGDEQEMLRLQDSTALIPVVSSRILTLGSSRILLSSKEDDTRSWGNFLVYFSHNAIPT